MSADPKKLMSPKKRPPKMTPMERRQKLIDDRAKRLARDAAKQGMTPEQLMKKRKDTYVNVAGGAALGALPVAGIVRGAGALYKALTGGAKAASTAKKASAATKVKKAVAATTGVGAKKGRRSGMAIRDKKTGQLSGVSKKTQERGKRAATALKGGAAASAVMAAADSTMKNQGQTTATAKTKAKNYNVGVSKGGVPFKEAFAHFRKKGAKTFTWNGKKYTTELAKKKK